MFGIYNDSTTSIVLPRERAFGVLPSNSFVTCSGNLPCRRTNELAQTCFLLLASLEQKILYELFQISYTAMLHLHVKSTGIDFPV